MLDAALKTKSCSQCGTENQSAAVLCCGCGEALPGANFTNDKAASDEKVTPQDRDKHHSIGPRAALGRLLSSMTTVQAESHLKASIILQRPRLKSGCAPLPKVTNPIVVALFESLMALPLGKSSARISIVNALGHIDDPSALSPLFLASETPSKEVRKATAKVLGCINHPLSAYLLLRLLQDTSSRVSQAAFQSLIRLDQLHTSEVILAACLSSKSLRKLILEIVRQISVRRRNAFFMRIKESQADNQPELKIVANWLRFEFRDVLSSDCLPDKSTADELGTEKQPPQQLESLIQQENDLESGITQLDDIDRGMPEVNAFESNSASEVGNSSDEDEPCEQERESSMSLESVSTDRDVAEPETPKSLETSREKSPNRCVAVPKRLSGTKHRHYLRVTVAVAMLFVVAPLLLVVLSLNGEAPNEDVAFDEPVAAKLESKSSVPPTLHNSPEPLIAEQKLNTSFSVPQQAPLQTVIAAQPTPGIGEQERSPQITVPEIAVATPIIQDVPKPIDVALESIEIDPLQPELENNKQPEEPVVADAGMLELPARQESGVNYYEATGHLAMRTQPQVPDPVKNQTQSSEAKKESQNESDTDIGKSAKSRSAKTRKPKADEKESVESVVAEAQADAKLPIERLLPGNKTKSDSKTVTEDVAIQTPVESAPVGRVENVVAVTNAKGWPIALIRSDLPDDVWWVQQVIGIQGNSFAARVNFGNEYSVSGSEYRMVIVFLDSPDEVRRFRIAKQFKDIPEGTRRSREFHYIRN